MIKEDCKNYNMCDKRPSKEILEAEIEIIRQRIQKDLNIQISNPSYFGLDYLDKVVIFFDFDYGNLSFDEVDEIEHKAYLSALPLLDKSKYFSSIGFR